jgi:hypothetical protein
MGLLFSGPGQKQIRRFIRKADDLVVFSPQKYKKGLIVL